MLGSLFLFLLSLPQGGKGGEMQRCGQGQGGQFGQALHYNRLLCL